MKLIVEKEGELLDYLYNNIDMPKKRIKQYLTHGSIFVNNNRTTKYNYKLVPGMSIVIDTDNKNKDYKGPIKVNDTTSSTGVTKSDKECNDVGNKESRTIEKIVYKDRPFYKYGFFILLVICIIETILLLIPKINKK